MPKRSQPSTPISAALTRREMLGRAANAMAMVVVSQGLVGCATDALGSIVTDTTGNSANASCVLTAALTEGPYFVDEMLNRSDIRVDPVTGAVSAGTPLALTFNLHRMANAACTPLTGATVDVWHADAAGVYSDVSGAGSGRKFLRGYQITDGAGAAQFTTVYPGWYQGRAVHTHFKVRIFAGSTKTYEFTSQFFFPEGLTTTVHAQSPYSTKGTRDTLNTTDGIYNSLSAAQKAALTLSATPTTAGYSGIVNLTVQFA